MKKRKNSQFPRFSINKTDYRKKKKREKKRERAAMGAEGTAEMARTRAIVVFIDRRFAESTKKSIRSRVHVLEQNLEAATTSQSVVLRCWPDQHEETEGSQGEVGEGGGGGHGADKAAFVREHEKRSSSGADGNVSSSGWRDMDAISNLTKDLNEDAIVDILWYCFPPSLRSLSLSLSLSFVPPLLCTNT